MKKILTILLLALGAVMPAAAQAPKAMAQVIKDYNAKCPVEISEGTMLKQVENTDDGIVFTYSVDGNLFANLVNLAAILHDSLLAEMVSSPDADTQAILSYAKTHGTKIIQRFVNTPGGTFDITILPEEL